MIRLKQYKIVLLLPLLLISVSCAPIIRNCYIPKNLRQPVQNDWLQEGENLEKAYKEKYKKLEEVNIDRKTINDIYVDSKCDDPV